MAVVRVRALAAPRAVMKPEPPPIPSPPPSERCMRTTPTSAMTISRWMTMRKVSMKDTARTTGHAPVAPLLGCGQIYVFRGISKSCRAQAHVGARQRARNAAPSQGAIGICDAEKIGRLETGAADQRAVDI